MRNCSSRCIRSDAIAHLYKETARRESTGGGPGPRSTGRGKMKQKQKQKQKPSSGHQSACGTSCSKPACDGWGSNCISVHGDIYPLPCPVGIVVSTHFPVAVAVARQPTQRIQETNGRMI